MSNIGRSGAPVLQQESPPVASPPPAPVRTRRIQVKAAVSYQGMLGPATKRARKICPRYEIDMLIDHRTEAGTEHSGGVAPLRRGHVGARVNAQGRRRSRLVLPGRPGRKYEVTPLPFMRWATVHKKRPISCKREAIKMIARSMPSTWRCVYLVMVAL
ncbi:hypothetical protein PR003_g23147 [Phytophthora rubi]|uniref:Uncharacterized protein n=1 Tax=Phytophthora rubi TaxID=129364 RepID=A0A6A3J681_9STRA|nr:hypothetical protein PR002_g22190 [Phytophthora rubi]KAE9298765.1 hypothetical protein PR003_g23147 [Phytophthora rubi]